MWVKIVILCNDEEILSDIFFGVENFKFVCNCDGGGFFDKYWVMIEF